MKGITVGPYDYHEPHIWSKSIDPMIEKNPRVLMLSGSAREFSGLISNFYRTQMCNIIRRNGKIE